MIFGPLGVGAELLMVAVAAGVVVVLVEEIDVVLVLGFGVCAALVLGLGDCTLVAEVDGFGV